MQEVPSAQALPCRILSSEHGLRIARQTIIKMVLAEPTAAADFVADAFVGLSCDRPTFFWQQCRLFWSNRNLEVSL
jgi:hypothetical protein